jgi:hypothetical protein
VSVFLILLAVMVACLAICAILRDALGVLIFTALVTVLLLGGGIDGLLHLFGAVA